MSVHIRFAKPEDVPQILDLIRELAEYEKEPQEVTITEEEMVKDGLRIIYTNASLQKKRIKFWVSHCTIQDTLLGKDEQFI